MKCPYFSKTEDGIAVEKYKHDSETDHIVQMSRTYHSEWQMAECIKEECAAWRDGRCHYKE